MNTNALIQQGKSNHIVMLEDAKKKRIQKQYEEKLSSYDVFWPLSRRDVECFTHQKLSALSSGNSFFHQPALYDQFDLATTLTMEYIQAPTLLQLLTSENTLAILPSTDELAELIRFLSRVNQLNASSFTPKELSLLQKQSEIVACMYHNKHNDSIPVLTDDSWQFCLGDVSLSNILFDGKRFTLIDFECAHMGYLGYDIGQLLGMASFFAKKSSQGQLLHERLAQAIEKVTLGKERNSILSFSESFEKYYTKNQ